MAEAREYYCDSCGGSYAVVDGERVYPEQALRAELAAARERARSAIHAAYRHGYARGHSHAETHQPRFQPQLEADLYMQELPDAVSEWLAAPTSAAHTGEGGEP